MSNVFNIKRFGKYFKYDLNNAANNFGLSMLIIGLIPVVLLCFTEVFGLIVSQRIVDLNDVSKIATFCISIVALTIISPAKLYGHLTEKRAGSDWLMIPASSFEKFLSMAIMLCVIVPLAFLVLFCGSDLILSLIPCYGSSITLNGIRSINSLIESVSDFNVMQITPLGYSTVWLSFCSVILAFGLGAICFKKSKAGKVFLCYFALSFIFSSLGLLLFEGLDFDIEEWFGRLTPEKVQSIINLFLTFSYLIIFGALLGGMYARIRTLKH